VVYNCSLKFNEERESKFEKILSLLEKQSPETFYINEKFCLNRKTIESSVKEGERSFDEFTVS
jgi:hypothetical protein